jgi:hypothetical protein
LITLVSGFFAYRVVKDRDGAPDPVDALVRAKNSRTCTPGKRGSTI